jgi:two-component system CheB/CheR fusion protein
MGSRKQRGGIHAEGGPALPQAEPGPVQEPGIPVVGIGASAGGLGAFEAFMGSISEKAPTGMAFVLVQHLAPDHKSLLTELVKRFTWMQVFAVEDGMVVQADCVYVIPPNRDLTLLGGRLQLLEQTTPRGHHLPIDFFFRSLAQDQGERAIGIVLSGTGSDGTLGIRSIKGEGGMAMAQTPESTEYSGMPQSAIATGLVDYILPPEAMPPQLLAYTAQALGRGPAPVARPGAPTPSTLKAIFVLLRSQTGHDFSCYKQNTIQRRVERRMAVQHVARMEDYARFLQHEPKEVEALFRDLLIGVTRFFRDPEAFAVLQKEIVPGLFAGKAPGDQVRVWVPGCSTGEEAYSIAILLQEHMETLKAWYKLQVFATDLDPQAIQHGRAGRYPANIAADVAPERLQRFFTQEPDQGAYRINKAIRDLLVFSEQDLVRDPPFSRLDLLSCRNLLIYLGPELQTKLTPLFNYALNPGGALFLGSSETVGGFLDLFTPVDSKWRIYQQKPAVRGGQLPAFGTPRPAPSETGGPDMVRRGSAGNRDPLQQQVEQELLGQYAPAAVAVDRLGEIRYIHGRTGHFLEPAPGEISVNILQMAREGLRQPLAAALQQQGPRPSAARFEGLRVRTNGGFSTVNLSLRPLKAAGPEDLVLVAFEEPAVPGPIPSGEGAAVPAADADRRIEALKQELRAKDETLQSTLEEMQTSNEELKSINEEMQSGNEELQSTNEEMETSREELQSTNEELSTVNAELQQRMDELTRTNNDLNNLMAGTGVATIFLDNDLRIRRFTAAATLLINLIPGDVGRPLSHISSNLTAYGELAEDAQRVLRTLVPRETEVQVKGGDWYLLRILPYRNQKDAVEGAVIIFVDITEQRRLQAALKEAEALNRLAVVVRDASDAITMRDFTGQILAWNPGAERIYGWTEAEALAMNARDTVPPELRDQALAMARQLSLGKVLEPHCTRRLARDGSTFEVWLTLTALVGPTGNIYAIATTERKIGLGD